MIIIAILLFYVKVISSLNVSDEIIEIGITKWYAEEVIKTMVNQLTRETYDVGMIRLRLMHILEGIELTKKESYDELSHITEYCNETQRDWCKYDILFHKISIERCNVMIRYLKERIKINEIIYTQEIQWTEPFSILFFPSFIVFLFIVYCDVYCR
jgi:hypothetical protein